MCLIGVLIDISLMINDVEHIFIHLLAILCFLWKKNVPLHSLLTLKTSVCISFLVMSCVCSLYILDINPLSEIWFASIFSHPFYLFYLDASFAV
jgi:hypothetical protein